MSPTTKAQFTIGKLDAGMAILLTSDHHQIEFPSILLPKTVVPGSIIDLSVTQNPVQEHIVQDNFSVLQSTIRGLFGAREPLAPVLRTRNVTQTSAVLEWDAIDVASAELRSLTLWRDGTRLGSIPKPLSTTTTKLSGLGIDTEYTFQLKLRTSAGEFFSEAIKVRTHKMTNLSGITVCEGVLSHEAHDRLHDSLTAIGGRPVQKRVRIDTTHFICSVPEGEEYLRAKEMNVPIVVVEWIEQCRREGRIVGVRGFYLDAEPAARQAAMRIPGQETVHTAEEVAPPQQQRVVPEVKVTPAKESKGTGEGSEETVEEGSKNTEGTEGTTKTEQVEETVEKTLAETSVKDQTTSEHPEPIQQKSAAVPVVAEETFDDIPI
jgi:chitin biosynthesis protein CHS5